MTLKINRILGPAKIGAARVRLVRVEMSTQTRDLFVSISLIPRLFGIWRSYREFRLTVATAQLHYRETAWRPANTGVVSDIP